MPLYIRWLVVFDPRKHRQPRSFSNDGCVTRTFFYRVLSFFSTYVKQTCHPFKLPTEESSVLNSVCSSRSLSCWHIRVKWYFRPWRPPRTGPVRVTNGSPSHDLLPWDTSAAGLSRDICTQQSVSRGAPFLELIYSAQQPPPARARALVARAGRIYPVIQSISTDSSPLSSFPHDSLYTHRLRPGKLFSTISTRVYNCNWGSRIFFLLRSVHWHSIYMST